MAPYTLGGRQTRRRVIEKGPSLPSFPQVNLTFPSRTISFPVWETCLGTLFACEGVGICFNERSSDGGTGPPPVLWGSM